MEDLKNAVNESMQKIISDGSVEKMIEEKLKKTVNDIIDSQLSSYSDFGKKLQEKIKTGLSVSFDKVSFPEYNQTILRLVEGIVNNAVTDETQKKFKEDLLKLFGKPPAEIKLSELIEKYIEENKDDEFEREEAERIALIITPKDIDKYYTVALNPTDTKRGFSRIDSSTIHEWTDCKFYMSVRLEDNSSDRGKLSWINDKDGLKSHQFMPTCLHGFSRLLYQMYCAGSTIVFDQGFDADDYDTYYPEDTY